MPRVLACRNRSRDHHGQSGSMGGVPTFGPGCQGRTGNSHSKAGRLCLPGVPPWSWLRCLEREEAAPSADASSLRSLAAPHCRGQLCFGHPLAKIGATHTFVSEGTWAQKLLLIVHKAVIPGTPAGVDLTQRPSPGRGLFPESVALPGIQFLMSRSLSLSLDQL